MLLRRFNELVKTPTWEADAWSVEKVRAWRIEAEQIVQARIASIYTASTSASTDTTTSTSASSSAPDGKMITLSLDNLFNMAFQRYHGSVSGEQAFPEDNSQGDLSPRESSNPLEDLLPEFHCIYPLDYAPR